MLHLIYFRSDFQNEAAIDAKYTTFNMNKRMAARAISGPTSDVQAPFIWSACPKAIASVPHDGHPGQMLLGSPLTVMFLKLRLQMFGISVGSMYLLIRSAVLD
jgi:hypothetical protein